MTQTASHRGTAAPAKPPYAALACIATASLITMMTETLPAGLLPQLALGLRTTPALAGQAVSSYAAASMLAALPLLALTRSRPQRPVLAGAIAAVGAASLLSALAPSVPVLLAARVLAGAAAGLLWALAAHYAMAISPEGQQARALSIAMLGVPVGMALGTPLGTFAGQALGWRTMLAILGAAGILTALWARAVLPALPGADAGADTPRTRAALLRPPLLALYAAAFLFEVGHMINYTYASQLADRARQLNPGTLLLVIGLSSIVGLLATGRILDRKPLRLFTLDLLCIAVALAVLWGYGSSPVGAVIAAILWGLSLGPTTTLAQAGAAKLADDRPDLAQGILVTILNAGMATGAALGGGVLTRQDVTALPLIGALTLTIAGFTSLICHRQTEHPRHDKGRASGGSPLG